MITNLPEWERLDLLRLSPRSSCQGHLYTGSLDREKFLNDLKYSQQVQQDLYDAFVGSNNLYQKDTPKKYPNPK